MKEENMHTFRLAFVCAFTGALTACNVAALHVAPLPTNVAAMKSMAADRSIQVRWGGWGYRGLSELKAAGATSLEAMAAALSKKRHPNIARQ
jgi:hypothetical protein